MVTSLAKTMLTPGGRDVYSQAREGLNGKTIEDIKSAMSKVDDEDVQQMAVELFEIKSDNLRTDRQGKDRDHVTRGSCCSERVSHCTVLWNATRQPINAHRRPHPQHQSHE